jgi:hypothetical protein
MNEELRDKVISAATEAGQWWAHKYGPTNDNYFHVWMENKWLEFCGENEVGEAEWKSLYPAYRDRFIAEVQEWTGSN